MTRLGEIDQSGSGEPSSLEGAILIPHWILRKPGPGMRDSCVTSQLLPYGERSLWKVRPNVKYGQMTKMRPVMRRIRYSCAMSLDGCTAGMSDKFDWTVINPAIDLVKLSQGLDTNLLCRRMFVFSRTVRQGDYKNVTVIGDKWKEVAESLDEKSGKDIWLFGGNCFAVPLNNDNHSCRPVASPEDVTRTFNSFWLTPTSLMSPQPASTISLRSAQNYTNCLATTPRH